VPQPTKELYDHGLTRVNRALARMGVTSYLPTVTSQRKEVYHQVRHPESMSIPSLCLILTRDWLDPSVTRAFRSAPSRGRWCRVAWRTHRRTVSLPAAERSPLCRSPPRRGQRSRGLDRLLRSRKHPGR
jgi:hypothetical protein